LVRAERESLAATRSQVAAKASRSRWTAAGLGGLGLLVCAWALSVVRRSTRSLRKTTRILAEGSAQAAAGARQVKDARDTLESSAAEQSRSVTAASSTAEMLASMTRANAEHAGQSAVLMARVDEGVHSANSTLRGLQVSMEEIAAASSKVSGIIKVIDGVAFQTNILALNAAVEAARAGEAGLSFAVVADEVRNLAQRCAEAARDTSSLVEESVVKSREGRARLEDVIGSIQGITQSSAEVKALVDDVSVGSQEQALGIEEIGRAVHQMEKHVQQVSSSVESLALAGDRISAQTTNVENGVTRLHELVDGVHAAAPPSSARRAVPG
jgi:methyl-accepting chemotaxis protein